MFKTLARFFRLLGPGLISGAADNDPAGIATYTQVGAQFGYGQLWTAIFALPLLTAVQEACARIGLVTGKGLGRVIHDHYGKPILYGVVLVLLVTNTINIGADIGAMAEAARLIIPAARFVALMLVSVALILVLEIFTSYRVYARYLKYLALIQLIYLVTAFIVQEPWGQVLKATFVPHVEWNFAFLILIVGNIGTTIAPYLFFWEASQEAEEDRENGLIEPSGQVDVTPPLIRRMQLDNASGMFASQVVTWSIIVVGASVLHPHGVTNLKTAADAALALEPLVHTFPHAGFLAKLLFAIGIISAGLLVIPIFSASAAYALSEAVGWSEGLNLKLRQAHGFYGVITISSMVGLLVNFLGIDLIKLLVYTSILNGVAAIPLLFLISRIAGNRKIMGEHASGRLSQIMLIVSLVVMAGALGGALVSAAGGR